MKKLLCLITLIIGLGTFSTVQAKKVTWVKAQGEASFPILMYHSIDNVPGNGLCVPKEQLEEEMAWLHKNDYYTLTPKQAIRVLTKNEVPKDKKIVWITFDDGYANNYTVALPILKKYKLKATVNMITSSMNTNGMLTTDQIKKMQKTKLISFESHTVRHVDLRTLTPEQQDNEAVDSKRTLQKDFGINSRSYCYPAGRYNDYSKVAAKNAGYKVALTTQPGWAKASDGLYDLKRVRIPAQMTLDSFIESVEYK